MVNWPVLFCNVKVPCAYVDDSVDEVTRYIGRITERQPANILVK